MGMLFRLHILFRLQTSRVNFDDWPQFYEAFLEKYVPRRLRERLRDEFTDLTRGSFILVSCIVRDTVP